MRHSSGLLAPGSGQLRTITAFWIASAWLGAYRESADGGLVMAFDDVDAGPVIAGVGTAASAFGIGAARSVGDRSRARALALEAIAVSWPLPNDRLLMPRVLSDAADAPLLGEAAMLYNLTQPSAPGFEPDSSTRSVKPAPRVVWLALLVQCVFGTLLLRRGLCRMLSGR